MVTLNSGTTLFGIRHVEQRQGSVNMPPVPAEVTAVREAARKKHPEHDWTGVNLVRAGAHDDVKEFLGESRDAARTLLSSNADMWVVRHSYHTGEPMQAFLDKRPPGDKLKLRVTTMPSWHAQASGDYQVKSELARAPVDGQGRPKLTPDLVAKAMRASPNYAGTVEREMGKLDDLAFSFVRNYDRMVHQERMTPAQAKELVGKLVERYGKMAMGEKFSRENFYNVLVKLPDGKTVKKRFDVTGAESDKRSIRTDAAHHSTLSPEIDIDLSGYKKGDKIVVQAWPDGSAGVYGYREARETVINL